MPLDEFPPSFKKRKSSKEDDGASPRTPQCLSPPDIGQLGLQSPAHPSTDVLASPHEEVTQRMGNRRPARLKTTGLPGYQTPRVETVNSSDEEESSGEVTLVPPPPQTQAPQKVKCISLVQ